MIVQAKAEDIIYVMSNMRECDLHERETSNPSTLADDISCKVALLDTVLKNTYALLCDDGRPFAVAGSAPVSKHTRCLWGWATDDADWYPHASVKAGKQLIEDCFSFPGCSRVECRVMGVHKMNKRFLKNIGMIHETELKDFGGPSVNFDLYSCIRRH